MTKMNTDLITCIKAALYEQAIDCDITKCMDIAYAHGVMNLLYYAAMKMPADKRPDQKVLSTLKHKAYSDVMREVLQQKTLNELYRRFESSQIRCVTLKGAVIKELYPKPELRYMSDVDILIDATKAVEVRAHFEALGSKVLQFGPQTDTDQYLTPEGLNFEIKKTLASESFNAQTHTFTKDLLTFAQPHENYKFVCRLPNEEHYAYILCHAVKHLIDGGVGVRPIMDIWICKRYMQLDREKLEKLLKRLELTKFAQRIEHLAEAWFGDIELNDLDYELGAYILKSGAFGTAEQRVADRIMTKKVGKNRFSYILRRFFLPYYAMKKYYPILQKIPILLPLCWLWRLIYAGLFRREKLLNEIGTVVEANLDNQLNRVAFFERCGINFDK